MGQDRRHLNHTWPAAQPGLGPDKAQALSFFFSSIYALNQQTLGYEGQSKLSSLNKGIHQASGVPCNDKYVPGKGKANLG